MEEKKFDIDKLLAEKAEIERILKSQFSKTVAVMFTDIKGSTSFYELRGDLEGRAMVHQHNEIVIPQITLHNGTLIKTIGDATLSFFEDPFNALHSAIAIQQALYNYNFDKTETDQIHVKIGLNYGTGIVQQDDIYGDVVNVASRVVSIAGAGEIIIPEDFYRKMRGNDEFIFRYVGTVTVKGKQEPFRTYRLLWNKEELSIGKLRGGTEIPYYKEGFFVLEASQSGQILKVSGYEKESAEEVTLIHFKEKKYNDKSVREYTRGIIELLNRANREQGIGDDLSKGLKEYGRKLYDELLPSQIKENLALTQQRNLLVSVDDTLVHIPWELLHDGNEFLCRRFSTGRRVSTRQPIAVAARAVGRPLKMLILADPCGDLAASYKEGVAIKNAIGELDDKIDVSLKTSDITKDYVIEKIQNFDVVHYAGHAEHDASDPGQSGLVMKNGRLTAAEIMNAQGPAPMPSLIFSNACQTGQSEEFKIDEDYANKVFGLANAFLLTGVQHYIGTFWKIPDEAGCHFAISFYKEIINGIHIGEALRKGREALIEKYGDGNIVWASYMLYGNPSTRYVETEEKVLPGESTVKVDERGPSYSRLRMDAEALKAPTQKSKYTTSVLIGIAGVILIALVLFFMREKFTGERGIPIDPTTTKIVVEVKEKETPKIDELITDLAQKYREGKIEKPETRRDAWSSRPLTMVFMDIKDHSGNQKREDTLSGLLTQSLPKDTRIRLVERQFLMKLLEELKLGTSVLADPGSSLKLGRLLSAQIIIFGSIIPDDSEQTIVLKCIDTETTQVRKVINVINKGTNIDPNSIHHICTQISEWVKIDFPLQGRILSLSGDTCIVNLGEIHGLKEGDRLEVLPDQGKGVADKRVSAELKIEQVGKDSSSATIVKKEGKILKGNRVREKKA